MIDQGSRPRRRSSRPQLEKRPATGSTTSACRPSRARQGPAGSARCPGRAQEDRSRAIKSGNTQSFEFTPAGDHALLARRGPLTVGDDTTLGVLVVAKPQTELRDTWVTLMKFFGVSHPRRSARRRRPRLVRVPRASPSRARALAAADEIARGNTTSPCPPFQVATRSATSPTASGEMAARLAEAEERERNFLMTVSHELRTPLTAIRGHVEAMREGLTADDPVARSRSTSSRPRRRGSSGSSATSRPGQARRAPVHRAARGGRHGPAARPGLRRVRRGGAAPLDRLPSRHRRRPGRSSPTATGCCRSSRTCSRMPSAGRRTEAASTSGCRRATARSRCCRRHRPGHPAEERERIFRPFFSAIIATAVAPGSGSRSRGSSRWRSAGASSSTRRPQKAAVSGWSCP